LTFFRCGKGWGEAHSSETRRLPVEYYPRDLLLSRAIVASEEVDLVHRCLRGEPEAVQSLVRRFQAEVYGLCVRLLHNRHDAEDVSQEVFLRVFRSLRRWDSSRPLKPWIMGITVNRCRTWMAQRARRPEVVDYLQDTATTPLNDDAAELLQEIRTAVGALRPHYQNVFVLFHEQGHPYEDIAAALERPVGTIKTWLHRARLEVLERLRQRGMVSSDLEPNTDAKSDKPAQPRLKP